MYSYLEQNCGQVDYEGIRNGIHFVFWRCSILCLIVWVYEFVVVFVVAGEIVLAYGLRVA